MRDIMLVFGTRPEAIKLGPVAAELQKLEASYIPFCTGQHTDLLAGTPVESDLANADYMNLASDGIVPRWVKCAQSLMQRRIIGYKPKLIVVQGDTMSAYTGATVSELMEVPLAHVEAGVRSHNVSDPWPEEETRVAIAQIARWHYAPTSTAFGNLVAEGVAPEKIRVTGNPVVSALARYAPDVRPVSEPERLILITLHRREIQRHEEANSLYNTIGTMALAHPDVRFVWPLHPAMTKLIRRVKEEPSNLELVKPKPYSEMISLLSLALGVLTDSGGLVEEAAVLGVPTIVLRRVNDRPEAEEAGIAKRLDPDANGVVTGVEMLLAGELKRGPRDVFGAATAAAEIAGHLAQVVK